MKNRSKWLFLTHSYTIATAWQYLVNRKSCDHNSWSPRTFIIVRSLIYRSLIDRSLGCDRYGDTLMFYSCRLCKVFNISVGWKRIARWILLSISFWYKLSLIAGMYSIIVVPTVIWSYYKPRGVFGNEALFHKYFMGYVIKCKYTNKYL